MKIKIKPFYVIDRFLKSFLKNTGTWLMFFLFLIVEYANYEKGKEIHQLCDLLGEHLMSIDHPTTPRQKIDNICLNHEPYDGPDDFY